MRWFFPGFVPWVLTKPISVVETALCYTRWKSNIVCIVYHTRSWLWSRQNPGQLYLFELPLPVRGRASCGAEAFVASAPISPAIFALKLLSRPYFEIDSAPSRSYQVCQVTICGLLYHFLSCVHRPDHFASPPQQNTPSLSNTPMGRHTASSPHYLTTISQETYKPFYPFGL